MDQYEQLRETLLSLTSAGQSVYPLSFTFVLENYSIPLPEPKTEYTVNNDDELNAMIDEIKSETETNTFFDVGNLKFKSTTVLDLNPEVIIPLKARGMPL